MKDTTKSSRKRPPGRNPEESDMRCIALATNLAEEQLEKGTASSQVITHYLKLGSSRAQLETERLKLENELLKAKTESLRSQKRTEELFADAISAFKKYQGVDEPESDVYDE